MRRRDFLWLAAAATTFPRAGLAQQLGKMRHIVVLSNGLAEERKQAILQGLADYGYVNGRTVDIELLTAPTIADVPAFAAQAVARRPDIIITAQSAAPLALKELATDIPVVFSGLEDPVAIGVVPNYGRPGGNMTGYMFGGPDVAGKRMQILSEALPGVSSLALIGLPTDPTYRVLLSQTRTATDAYGIEPILFEVKEGVDFVALFEDVRKSGAKAVYPFVGAYVTNPPNVAVLAQLAIRYRLPSFGSAIGAQNGMLLGYGAHLLKVARRSAAYVDAILRGARPSDLPIMPPTEFELIVNLRTASALRVMVPQSVLFQATEVIS